MTTDTEALVRRAYHLAEGDVLDVQGFIDLFTEDGVFNGIGGVSGQESYRGEQLGDVVVWMGKFLPDVHRELHRVNVLGDVVAIELSIQGTFLGPFETPAGVIQPTGAKLDIPTADFWYVRDGKIQDVQLPYRYDHHVRAAGRTAGLRVRSRGVCARTIRRPTDKGVRLLSSRTLQAGLRRVGWPAVFCDPLDLDRVEAEYLHVRRSKSPLVIAARSKHGFCSLPNMIKLPASS